MDERIDARLNWLNDMCTLYAYGKQLYDSSAQALEAEPGSEMIVSSANLGDTVYIATFSKAYKEVHGVNNLVICAKKRQANAVEWFEGVDGIVGLTDEEMLCLRYYITISRKFNSNHIRYGHVPCYIDWDYPGTFFHIPPGFEGLPLIKAWEQRVLELPDNSPKCDIIVPDNIEIPQENIEVLKNAVLIAPASFTVKGIPVQFWEKLTVALKENGFFVFCNSGGLPYDTIIDGSKELVLSTKDLILHAPLFKHIISIRSGLTDLVSKTNAKLTVLHTGEARDSLYIEYGTIGDDVRDLGRMQGIYPMFYDEEREDELIRLIVEDAGRQIE